MAKMHPTHTIYIYTHIYIYIRVFLISERPEKKLGVGVDILPLNFVHTTALHFEGWRRDTGTLEHYHDDDSDHYCHYYHYDYGDDCDYEYLLLHWGISERRADYV